MCLASFVLPADMFADLSFVAVIGGIFLLMQLGVCLRFWLRMRRQERELKKLLAALEAGEDGRDIEAFSKDIRWLAWVDRCFPRDSNTPGSYTRDDVLKELDVQISGDSSYLFLQRTGVMAPLLGVILTFVGFVLMLPKMSTDTEQSLSDILVTVIPLAAGVGTGAVLAFLNQWLLHFAGGKVEAVRTAARAWFDAAIWSHVGLDTQAATVKAITAMERMAKAVNATAKRQEHNADKLQKSIEVIYRSSETFQQTYAAFGEELGELPTTLKEVTDAAQAAVAAVESLIPVGQRAIAGLDDSVVAFRTAVEGDFSEATRSQRETSETLAESISRINESTMHLKVSSGDLQRTVGAHTNAFKSLNRSLQNQVLPAHETFHATMTQFNGQAEGLLERFEALQGDISEALAKITALAPGAAEAMASFTNSTSSFSDAVRHKFAPAADEHQESTDKLSASIEKLHQSAGELSEGETVVHNLVRLQTRLGEELTATQESLRRAVDQLTETATQLNQSYTGELAPSHQVMQHAANTFAESASELAAFVQQGIGPATDKLVQLDQTLQRVGETTRSIQQFAESSADIQRLTQSLAQAAQVSQALAELPNNVKQVLEEVAAAHQQQLNSHSQGSWFQRRRAAR